MSLRFEFSWADGSVVRGPDAFAWADVCVRLGDRTLDAVDMRLRTIQSRFVTSLLPLCEWLIEAWPRLIEERAISSGPHRHAWDSCHSLRFARAGGPMPNVVIRRSDDAQCAVVAHEDLVRPPGIDLSFLVNAQVAVDVHDVARELSRVVDGVIQRLRGHDDWMSEHLTELWTRARSPAALIAGRLGLSLTQYSELGAAELAALDEIARDRRLILYCEASTLPLITDRVRQARELLSEILPALKDQQPESDAWRELRIEQKRRREPWHEGWDAAEQFRAAASFAESPPGKALPRLLEDRFGWTVDNQVRRLPKQDAPFDMIQLQPQGRMPTAFTALPGDNAKRFRLAKAVFYALWHSDSDTIVDSARMPGHSVANAFAAELLAPRSFIAKRIPSGGVWTEESLERVAEDCAVHPRVIEHQIENRDLGIIAGR